jgi:hypothetical protein
MTPRYRPNLRRLPHAPPPDEPLAMAKGLLYALRFLVPFWLVAAWLIWRWW